MKNFVNTFSGASSNGEGMTFKGINFSPVVEECSGCSHVSDFEGKSFCSGYSKPAAKWMSGKCNFSTHVKDGVTEQAKVNPLKASKRSTRR